MALDSILSTPVIPPPPKGTTAPATERPARESPAGTTGGSSGGDSSSPSTTASSASDSGTPNAASHSSGSAARNSSKPAGTGQGNSASRNAKSSAAAQSASSSSKARQSSATSQTQANATNIPRAAAQNKNPGPSFIEALAQTQADAQDSATATAAAAPQEVTGGKPKGAKDDHSDTTGTALGILSQSLAAAMAGLQPANPGQSPQTTADDDSTDTVSLAGAGSATIQSVVANIAQGAAEELAHGSSGLKATATTDGKADPAVPATDNTAAAATAFQAHMASRTQSTANADALSNKVNTPVGDTGFADEVGDKITWMANQGVQSASLQLTPEHLGPVEVRISVQNGSASVSFNAAHADTRAALEQTLPHLREMFSTQGLTLTDASVSQQSPRGQPQRQSAIGAISSVSGGDDSTSQVATVTRAQLGLVDTYA